MARTSTIWLAVVAATGVLWLASTPGMAVADERVCTAQVGDFDKEPYPVCSWSCLWSDIPPKSVVEILSRPERWADTFRTVVNGEFVQGDRLLMVYKVKPFGNRQVTVELTVTETEGVWRVAWRKATQQEPLAEGLVEIEIFEGFWEVSSDGNGGSKVTTGTRLNPGEDVPRILVRKALPMQLRRLLRQLRRAVG